MTNNIKLTTSKVSAIVKLERIGRWRNDTMCEWFLLYRFQYTSSSSLCVGTAMISTASKARNRLRFYVAKEDFVCREIYGSSEMCDVCLTGIFHKNEAWRQNGITPRVQGELCHWCRNTPHTTRKATIFVMLPTVFISLPLDGRI